MTLGCENVVKTTPLSLDVGAFQCYGPGIGRVVILRDGKWFGDFIAR